MTATLICLSSSLGNGSLGQTAVFITTSIPPQSHHHLSSHRENSKANLSQQEVWETRAFLRLVQEGELTGLVWWSSV